MKTRIPIYRAWDHNKGIMRDVLSIWNSSWYDNENDIDPNVSISNIVLVDGDQAETLFSNFTLVQYTGIEDIEGRRIFEGDILAQDAEIKAITSITGARITGLQDQIVHFHEGAFKVRKSSHAARYQLSGKLVRRNGLRVVGNIFEKGENHE